MLDSIFLLCPLSICGSLQLIMKKNKNIVASILLFDIFDIYQIAQISSDNLFIFVFIYLDSCVANSFTARTLSLSLYYFPKNTAWLISRAQ